MRNLIRPAVVSFTLLTLLTGVAYPLAVTGVSLALFPTQSRGSLFETGEGKQASSLIGQSFAGEKYFWPRPSAAGTFAYNPLGSAGSNLAPSNPALAQAVQERVKRLKAGNPSAPGLIPVDLVTASASGIDPHISVAAADYQIARVARARGMAEADMRTIVLAHTESPVFGLLGEARVNVLKLNLALDHHTRTDHPDEPEPQVGFRARGFLEGSK